MTLGDARAEYLGTLDTAAERVAAQIGYLFSQVGDVDDYTGWTGLATTGSRAIEAAQSAAVDATAGYLGATLQAAGVAETAVNVAGVQVGRLGSGRDVAGLLTASQRVVVAATMAGGATFPEALASSQARVVGIAVSEPARIGRDGSLATGQADPRFGRFRRIAEPGACDFCRMLATRGAVYLTEETAGKHAKYHLWCRCHVELVVSAEAIAASKALSSQWRTAIQSDEAMQRAGAMQRAAAMAVPPQWRDQWEAAVARLPEDRGQINDMDHLRAIIDAGRALDDELETRLAARAASADTGRLRAAVDDAQRAYAEAARVQDEEYWGAWTKVVAEARQGAGGETLAGFTFDDIMIMAIDAPTGENAEAVRLARALAYRVRLATETKGARFLKLKAETLRAEKRWRDATAAMESGGVLKPGSAAYAEAMRDEVVTLLGEIRDMGGRQVYMSSARNATKAIQSGDALRAMRFAEDAYPAQWHEMLHAFLDPKTKLPEHLRARVVQFLETPRDGTIKLGSARRGYNRGGNEIRLSTQTGRGHLPAGDTKGQYQVATHELGHSFERSVPGLRQAEWLFSRSRSPRSASKLEHIPGGGPLEYAHRDDWATLYTGKVYEDSPTSSWEIFTTGMESLVAGSPYFEREGSLGYDREFRSFMLGVLSAL